jgi:hypothetical protein
MKMLVVALLCGMVLSIGSGHACEHCKNSKAAKRLPS